MELAWTRVYADENGVLIECTDLVDKAKPLKRSTVGIRDLASSILSTVYNLVKDVLWLSTIRSTKQAWIRLNRAETDELLLVADVVGSTSYRKENLTIIVKATVDKPGKTYLIELVRVCRRSVQSLVESSLYEGRIPFKYFLDNIYIGDVNLGHADYIVDVTIDGPSVLVGAYPSRIDLTQVKNVAHRLRRPCMTEASRECIEAIQALALGLLARHGASGYVAAIVSINPPGYGEARLMRIGETNIGRVAKLVKSSYLADFAEKMVAG